MPATAETISITCAACHATADARTTPKGLPRLPRGWKKRPDPDTGATLYTCKDCQRSLYRLRAVVFPVAEVLSGGTWREFCAAVRQALFRSRTLAQWAVNRLAATDVSRSLDMTRLPAHPPLGAEDKVYLYGLASREFADCGEWAGAYTAAQGVLRAVELKYGEKRKKVVWETSESVPTVRSQPYPVPAQNWTPEWTEYTSEDTGQVSRVPTVNVPLGGRRWLLRLRGGRQRARQLAAFAQLVSGAAEKCELAIYRKRSQGNRDRSGDNGRTGAGGGARVRHDIMVKLVAWLPRGDGVTAGKRREGVLSVHSSKSAFLVAVHPDFERPWMLNRNEVRRRIVVHARRLERISEDSKAELRRLPNPRGPWPKLTPEEKRQRRALKRARRHRLDHYDKICRLYRDYVDTFAKEGAAWLAAYADRIGVAKVAIDLSERSYCPGFPWAALRDRIAANLEDRGIELEAVDGAMIALEDAGADEESTPASDNESL